MPFHLSPVNLSTDFPELMAVQWASYESPPQQFFRLFCPIQHNDRTASLQESTARMLEWQHHDAHAQWIKVTDTSTGKIVGAAWYKVYHHENPFAHHEREVAEWYPDDSTREFVSQAIEQMDGPRMEKGARPQVFANILFTHPDYRRRGIGRMLVQWGIDKARELDLEFWLNATPWGKPLYESLGFRVVQRNPLAPKTDCPDEKWRMMEEEFRDIVFYAMYLPREGDVGGK
ncbi:acyl-CoA N-acyltransferase [Byssothecium circinans]|uniref:Acyl-CoA N-acyltransferase n=1 Tax=Byssothecium circinans TaxID=147558 RepID=A0A6A5TBR0_9PLEO|nr:acyl-CoA N-acyltransferase [Byssothecium circinans]